MLKTWFAIFILAWVGLEIWMFLVMGQRLGVGLTFLWIIISALLGVLMMRMGAISSLMEVHKKLLHNQPPAQEILDMGLLLLGGILLIVPTFLTDILGLMLGFPPFRWVLRRAISLIMASLIFSVEPAQDGTPNPYKASREQDDDNVIEISKED